MGEGWSAIVFTSLGAAAQGLLLALFGAELAGYAGRGGTGFGFFALSGLVAFGAAALALLGMLMRIGWPRGRPSPWQEGVALAGFAVAALVWALGHAAGALWTRPAGAAAAAFAAFALIAARRPVRRAATAARAPLDAFFADAAWAGLASGATLAAVCAGARAPALVPALVTLALALTLAAFFVPAWRAARHASAAAPMVSRTALICAALAVALPTLVLGAVLWFAPRPTLAQWWLALAFVVQLGGFVAGRRFALVPPAAPAGVAAAAVASTP